MQPQACESVTTLVVVVVVATTVPALLATTVPALLLELLRRTVLVGVVPVGVTVVLVVHVLGVLLGVLPGLMFVPLVHALGLGELVDLTADEASEKFLSKGVVNRLPFLALVVLEELEAFEGGGASYELMGELGLVVIAATAIDLLMSVLRFTPTERHVGL